MDRSMMCKRAWLAMYFSATVALGVIAPSGMAQETKPAQPAEAPASAPAENLPDAKEIHAAFIKAIGGEEAIKGLKSRVSKATMEIPAQGMKASMQTFTASGKMYSMTDITGIGQMEAGVGDGVAWQKSAIMGGAQIIDGAQKDDMARESDLQAELNVDRHFSSMKTVGVEEIGGKKSYKVEFTSKSGQVQTRSYEQESGLMVKISMQTETQMGKIPVEMKIEDYRDVGGVKVPFKMTQTAMGQEVRFAFESIEHNVEIPSEKFAMPDDVKKLLEKKQASPATPAEPGKK